ncbi:MAG: DNA cytosine methyltransferase [Promethearchaeati archaeon SRVP18_Atabeyarchaeia-1]
MYPCRGNHPSASSVSHFVRLVKEIRPKGFLFENVVRFQNMDKWGAFDKDLNDLGYRLSIARLEAQWFGIPQMRRRLFVAGFLDNAELDFSLLKRIGATCVSDAIQDLLPLPRGGGGKENVVHPKIRGSPYLATLWKRANRLYNHWSTEHSDEVVETIRLIGQGKSLRKDGISCLILLKKVQ